MDPEKFDAEAMIDAMASFLDLMVEAEYRAGVKSHLEAARAIAVDVLAYPTDDEAEPAPVYRA